MKKENDFDNFKSPIPQHLTLEERIIWEREAEWEKKEYERRRKEGFYDDLKGNGIKKRKLKLRKLKE